MKNNIHSFLIAASIVISTLILAGAWKKSHGGRNTINVTGLATRDFNSDLIVWKASFSRKAMSLKEAYKSLKEDAEVIRKYLVEKEGIEPSRIIFSSVGITKEFDREYSREKSGGESARQVFSGYSLSQFITIESKDVEKVEAVSRRITELIDSGIELNSEAPRYYYTRLADLKIEMLASASKDARQRAEQISANAGGSLKELKSAEMGVFQITAPNSTEEYSWDGAMNTASRKKTVSITVKLEFQVD